MKSTRVPSRQICVSSVALAIAIGSAASAAQIRGLIGTSVEGVRKVARSAEGASGKIGLVAGSIEQVSGMIDGVSQAASRQSREIHQLSRTLGELDQVTQTNTRMVEAWTDRAGHMREEVERLAGLVRRFQLPEAAGAPGEPRRVEGGFAAVALAAPAE